MKMKMKTSVSPASKSLQFLILSNYDTLARTEDKDGEEEDESQ